MATNKRKKPNDSFYSKKYNPSRQTPPLAKFATVACLSLLVLFFLDSYIGTAYLSTAGPLSSSHSIWENKCDSCHSPQLAEFRSSMENRCLNCHPADKQFNLHISGPTPQASEQNLKKNLSCVQCHKEHRGRDFRVRETADLQCKNCHGFIRASTGHPEFDSNKMESPELKQIGLKYSHSSHLEIIIETGCPFCHQLDSEKGFSDIRKISFNENCKACHPLQELTITEIFPEEDLESLVQSVKVLEKSLGLESSDTFLSRFSSTENESPSSKTAALNYQPAHKDSYLNIWFTNKNFSGKQVAAALSKGPEGLVLNCLKCHVRQPNIDQAGPETQFGPDFAIVALSEFNENKKSVQFPHKKHANESCDLCHDNIFSSESLVDHNLTFDKKTCFTCHNNLTVKSDCVMCHQFH